MKEKSKSKNTSKYLILVIVFLLIVVISLGILLMVQSKNAIISLMHTRMLDVSNTAADMIDGDVLETITPADEGTVEYDTIMRTLTYFQDNIDLRYIYCIRDMGDGTFSFGLDPTVDDPGEFGSPIVYTDALYQASQGTPAADDKYYEDAWGKFYSAYSPVFDSEGNVAGIIAVDFDAEWFDQQLISLTRTTIIVAILALVAGVGIVLAIIMRSRKRIESVQDQLNELENTLMQEMGTVPEEEALKLSAHDQDEDTVSIEVLEKKIQSMQSELKTQIAQVHGHAYIDGLTGVKSKQAYIQMEQALDEKLGRTTLADFSIVVCDINGLKKINDTLGHQAGDEYICKACKMICNVFAHSPVYRVGGDEFTVFLTGRDYENRRALMHELHRLSKSHISTEEAIVSGGLADYIPDQDHYVREIFERADSTMYKEKMLLKSLGAAIRDEEMGQEVSDWLYGDMPLVHARRKLLIADDILPNREMLGDLLEEDYDIFYAADGVETLEILREHKGEISLLLLDLYMPNMTGREVMTEMQIDEDLMFIPVIVLTVDEDAELDCLRIGAMDFIPKPYPDIEIIKARIAKCIELSENRDLIRHTQCDRLTGLYNLDYFIRYVNRIDLEHKDVAFDALVCDVNQFSSVNEQFGQRFGDLVLHSIGAGIRKLARRTGGIGCRQRGDTFWLYCPHHNDYEQLLKRFLEDLFVDRETADKVSLRFGVFENAGRKKDVEERFTCAKTAADNVKKDPQVICGYYDYKQN